MQVSEAQTISYPSNRCRRANSSIHRTDKTEYTTNSQRTQKTQRRTDQTEHITNSPRTQHHKSQRGTTATHKLSAVSLTFHIVCAIMLFGMCINPTDAINCSRKCMNNGYMIMPVSIFGYCRCVCMNTFAGDACQYPTKRRRKMRRLVKIEDVIKHLIQKQMDMKSDK